MKSLYFSFTLLFLCLFFLSSCTISIIDFTVISTKDVLLNIDKTQGKKTHAQRSYFLGIDWNIQDVVNIALENAGKEYDLLVDGVVEYTRFPFILTVTVEGVAMSSNKMKGLMGETGYEDWLKRQNVFDPERPQIVKGN